MIATVVFSAVVPAQTLRERALKTLEKSLQAMADVHRHGGWAMEWSLDEKAVWGEFRPIADDWITVQPPATPTIAGTYLRAGKVLNETRWIDVARNAHTALSRLQSVEGGLPHEGPPDDGPSKRGSFDDGTTTEALAFFLDMWHHTNAAEDRAAVDRIGNFIVVSQMASSGGWPQSFPPPDTYGRYITFNDGNFSNIMSSLKKLATETGDPKYHAAMMRGAECILKLQGGDGEAIWAQQYDPETLEPAWARRFEPPGYTPAESVGVCNTLVALYVETGDQRYVASLGRALDWYDTHKLENGKYARLYEPGTQRPVYGRRDKAEKVYDFANACEGYGWQGDWYPTEAKKAYVAIQAQGGDAYRDEASRKVKHQVNAPAEKVITGICDRLSDEGFWTRNPSSSQLEYYKEQGVSPEVPMVLVRDFNVHVNQLLNYIEGTK
tara:strand:- start:1401 stop:2714 length:1314 start_codon:yes stop_codon:yes gene_type:complete